MSFTAIVRQAGDVSIIDLSGRVTGAEGADHIREAIKAEVDLGHKNILLNLDGVDYIDSWGLGAMASTFITVVRLGGKMKLLNTQPRVTSMLQVTRLYTVLVTFTNESEALASFAHELSQGSTS
jgi:anti-anti-sigma factor